MGIVLDYTSRIAPSALKAAGVVGVCRYLSPDQPNTRWKVITPAEYQELRGSGINVYLNWEYSATDWLGGSSVGRAHGTAAQIEAHALGYPAGSVILGSADFDMTRSQWLNAGRAYAQGFAAGVRAGGYRPGVYGPWDVLQWVADEHLMDAFWQAGMSTSWSGGRNAAPHPLAHLRQRGHKTVGGVDTDWNEIRRPLWTGGPAAPSGGTDMLVRDEHGTIYVPTLYGPQVVQKGEYIDGTPYLQVTGTDRVNQLCPDVREALKGISTAGVDQAALAAAVADAVHAALANVRLGVIA